MNSGYLYIENFLEESQLSHIETILRKFHQSWLKKHESFYHTNAINSSNITSGEFLSSEERFTLLKIVSSTKIITEAKNFLGNDIRFLNTQIFFNPFNEGQNNYWHRDIQYTGLSEDEQRKAIEQNGTQVVHLRLAIADENGIEFIPGSHMRWDHTEEYEVRLKLNNKSPSDKITDGKAVTLKRGDLLAFDANIIHRGLYGRDRFAFDILFCKPLPEIMKFLDKTVLPTNEELRGIEHPEVFEIYQ